MKVECCAAYREDEQHVSHLSDVSHFAKQNGILEGPGKKNVGEGIENCHLVVPNLQGWKVQNECWDDGSSSPIVIDFFFPLVMGRRCFPPPPLLRSEGGETQKKEPDFWKMLLTLCWSGFSEDQFGMRRKMAQPRKGNGRGRSGERTRDGLMGRTFGVDDFCALSLDLCVMINCNRWSRIAQRILIINNCQCTLRVSSLLNRTIMSGQWTSTSPSLSVQYWFKSSLFILILLPCINQVIAFS